MEEDDADGEESESDKEGVPSEDERCEEHQSEEGEVADAREEADVGPRFPFLATAWMFGQRICQLGHG